MTEDKSIFTAEHLSNREKVLARTGLTENEIWAILDKLTSFSLDEFERIKKEAGIGSKSLKGAETAGRQSRKKSPPAEVLKAEVKEERKGTRLNRKEACALVGKRYNLSMSTVYQKILNFEKYGDQGLG